MTLGCYHSPSVRGGVARRKSRQKERVAGVGRERESRNGVANVSREMGRERESRNGVASVSREMGSQLGVVKGGRECGSRK